MKTLEYNAIQERLTNLLEKRKIQLSHCTTGQGRHTNYLEGYEDAILGVKSMISKEFKPTESMGTMLECDGYKMFYGTVKVTPVNGKEPFDLTGTWLYKPCYENGEWNGFWICKPDHDFTRSLSPDILSDFRVD